MVLECRRKSLTVDQPNTIFSILENKSKHCCCRMRNKLRTIQGNKVLLMYRCAVYGQSRKGTTKWDIKKQIKNGELFSVFFVRIFFSAESEL